MINRKAMLGLLGSLPDAVLLQALQVAGDQVGAMEGTGFEGLAMDDGSNRLESWQEKTIPYNGGADRPAMVDKMWAKSSADQATQGAQPMPGGALETDSDIYLQTGGT